MKLLTTLSLLLIGIAAFAQNVSLTIFNNGGQQFFVIMNGIRQNSLPQTNVKIGGMTTGSYEVKLIFADGKTGDINKKIYFDTPADYLGRVVFKGKKGKLQYFGEANGTQLPGGGTNIQYRPNDQSGYSDQSSTMNTSGNGQYGGTSTQQTSANGQYGGISAQQTSQGTGQTTYGSGTGQSSSNGTTSSTQQTGSTTTNTGQTGTNTNVIVSDPSGTNGGTQTISTGTTITDPTGMNGGMQTTTTTTGTPNGTMSTGTTITDPNNPNGQFGVNININVQDPTMGGTGGINTTTTTTGMPSGNESMGTSTTISDPNNPNGQYGVNMNVSGTWMGNGTATSTSTTTSSSSTTQNGQVVNDSYNYQQTTSVTQNGQTTTQTYQSGKDYPGAPGTTGSGTFVAGQGTPPPASTNYSCTSVLADVDAFMAELNEQKFDADKRSMIETDLSSYCLSSDQAYRIIHTLTFDADKLDMSKFLYDRMTDKVNGKRLLELLTFDADKQDFKNYMKTH